VLLATDVSDGVLSTATLTRDFLATPAAVAVFLAAPVVAVLLATAAAAPLLATTSALTLSLQQ